MEVIIKAVNDIQEPKEAQEFLEKFKPKVRIIFIFQIKLSNRYCKQVAECSMSAILLKIVSGAIYLKNERKEAKRIIEEVEKELDGLGIVKPVHR